MTRSTPEVVTGEALEILACHQVELGRQLWLEHQMQPGGICSSCGHVYPCEDAEHGAWLVLYWEPYLPEESDRPVHALPRQG
jgi:hypothetical protein